MMGWLFYDRTPANIAAEIRRICTGDDGARSIAPVAISRVGKVWYVAVKASFATAELAQASSLARAFTLQPDHSYTFGAVILTERDGSQWGYKDMDETMGPVESRAPVQILEMLSPTTNHHALEWRERCRAAGPIPPDELWVRRSARHIADVPD